MLTAPKPSSTHGALATWRAGAALGLRLVATDPILGAKRLALPVSYWRLREFTYAFRQLTVPPGSRILDLGSPKDLATLLAAATRCDIVTCDILLTETIMARRFARALPSDSLRRGSVRAAVQDGRSLGFRDAAFDGAYSISVLEHIPGDGDGTAIQELCRVLKPGGLLVITVPYANAYRETFVDRPIYGRVPEPGGSVFFERHYDSRALHERLLSHIPMEVVDLQIWTERWVAFERVLSAFPGVRAALSPMEPLFSLLLLRPVATAPRPNRAAAAFLTLRKIAA